MQNVKRAPVSEPEAIAAARCRLYLLGAFRIQCDGHPVPLQRRKVESLLAYLALHPEEHAREKLAALFWAEFPDAQARHSLSNAVTALRRQLGDQLLLADRDTVQLNPAFPLWVDALEFQRRTEFGTQEANWAEPAQSAIDLYQGDLLSDFYDEWIASVRERLRTLYHETLLRLIEQARAQAEYGQAIEMGRRILTSDPASEQAHQHLMFCYAMAGNRTAALQQYKECEHTLREELAAEPTPETRALYEWIKQASPERGRGEGWITNLPNPLTSFVGREREIAHLKALVSKTRLLTLTGAGGSGKTRLAIQVARESIKAFQDGVWWVDLAPLVDSSLVSQTVAQVLGVPESPHMTLSEMLLNFLRSKQLLLVLDNCEHLVTRCAELAVELLTNCPGVQMMATSREALGITGESVWQVPTLSLPPLQHLSHREPLREYEAIQLFVERAAAVNDKFSLGEENAPAVAVICQRLDGIPLAIELAAARIKVLSPEQIAARLDNRFNLLTVGSRTALPRHQTLRLTFDWSHELLTETERVLFRRLSVFVGGFSLEAAEAVCTDEGIGARQVLELLSRLVDKSLVTAEQQKGERRFRLLETIRQYAHEKLDESGETQRLRKRHLEFFLRLAEEAEPRLTSAERPQWLERLGSEQGNLRAALEWSQEQAGRGDTMLRLAGSLSWFWYFGGTLTEGRRWLETALAKSPNLSLPAASRARSRNRARALCGAARLALEQGENNKARALVQESVTIWRAVGAIGKPGLAHALVVLGWVARDEGDLASARTFYEEAVLLFRERQDRWGLAYALTYLGLVPLHQEDYVAARSLLEESITVWEGLGDAWGLCYAFWHLGIVADRKGDFELAGQHFEKALAMARESGHKQSIAHALRNLGLVAVNQGDEARAKVFLDDALSLYRELGNKFGISEDLFYEGRFAILSGDQARAQSLFEQSLLIARQIGPLWLRTQCLEGFAALSAVRGQAERAVRLWAAVEALVAACGSYMDASDRRLYERTVAKARDRLDEEAIEAARARGQAMTLDQAIAYALSDEPV